MKYTLVLIFIMLVVNTTIAQEVEVSTALKLTKTLHSKKIEPKVRFIKEIKKTNETKDKKTIADHLYKKISQIYTTVFTPEEITNMFAFYNSALGKKIAENERKVNREVSTIIRQWETDQLSIEQRQTSKIVDERRRIETDSLRALKRKELIAKRKAERETPLPKINNLDDLKKLIEKQPYIISDRRLLLELFGKKGLEKLRNPESRVLKENQK
ncbi:DUF2059 domain-containing protein [Flavivirga jejuensis]|uniref:DUF2059 domain-containing protein n=1 Tax=Flavivirga jejuensis TaxID=870487 RepID=A0ABT8WNF2_9FLAO|nr:DUF2059 domain-containing protein [Flavivirga jejuensis]MDO5974514.1 DUF2059 domain-containing protein [Flavivirga jejuensis]